MSQRRAAIYARYSSDNQREASIEDQIEICRRYVELKGWQLVKVYADPAQSGASRFRPQYQQMVMDAEAGRFDAIVVEALDRLSRKLADVAELFDRLDFARVALHAVSTGEVTAMHVGLLGTMAQMQLKDLGEKTRRGQLGRALKGRIPGGNAYGYRVLPATADGAGARRIEPTEAAVVRRIFDLFAAGSSPRAIAKRLNAEGVPGPDGRPWGDTTISGQCGRGTGILNNALYVGRLAWNRCSYVKDPRTGKRVARPNPKERWEVVPVPELRIVDDELWSRVKARQEELSFEVQRDDAGNALNGARRRRFLLSGLLVCGVCGGGYTIVGKDRHGCAQRRSKGTCGNDRTIDRREIEARVLDGLKHRLLAADEFEAFARTFQEESSRLAKEAVAAQAVLEVRIAKAERKIAMMFRAIEDGLYGPSMNERMAVLEADKAAAAAELESLLGEPGPVRCTRTCRPSTAARSPSSSGCWATRRWRTRRWRPYAP